MSSVIGVDRHSVFHDREQPYYLKHVSRIKHDILKAYLGAWSGILGTKFPHLAYFDCFAGEGCYVDEHGQELPGSPQHALRVAADFVSKAPERSGLRRTRVDGEPSRAPLRPAPLPPAIAQTYWPPLQSPSHLPPPHHLGNQWRRLCESQ